MFFPVAGIEISPWIPPAAAFLISVFTSMAGVSGAFLLLPFQMSVLGFNTPAVSATNHLFNVIATPAGIWRFHKEGRMLWPLTGIIVVGTLPGVWIGALLRIHYLADADNFRMFAGLVLLYLSGKLSFDLTADRQGRQDIAERAFHHAIASKENAVSASDQAEMRRLNLRRLDYKFCGEAFTLSVPALTCLSLAVGVIGGTYGIGGGALIAPFLVSICRMPIYLAAGAALMGTFATSAAGVVLFCALAPLYPHLAVAPDWALGALFGLGGIAGIYTGARLQKHMPARAVKGILALCVLVPAVAYLGAGWRWR